MESEDMKDNIFWWECRTLRSNSYSEVDFGASDTSKENEYELMSEQ